MDSLWRQAPAPALRVRRGGLSLAVEANEAAETWRLSNGRVPADWGSLAQALDAMCGRGELEGQVGLGDGQPAVGCRIVPLDDGWLAWLLTSFPLAAGVPPVVDSAFPDREASEFLGRALVLADVEVWRIDLATRRVHYNLRGYRRLGVVPRAEGLDLDEMRATIHPEDREKVLAAADEALASDKVVDAIGRHRNPDGSWRTLLTRRVAYRDAHGRPTALAGVSIDLSDIVAERAHVLRLREQMNLLADAVGLGLWTREVGTGAAEWNEQMYRMHRRSPDAGPPSLAEWLTRHVHPLDAERMAREQQEADAHWLPTYQTEFRIPGDHGEVRWIYSWSRREIRDGRRMAFGVHIDITERKLAEQALSRERARAQFAIDGAGLGAWERSLEGQLLYWNERMYVLRGLDPRDSRPLDELARQAMGDTAHAELTEMMMRQLESGEPYEHEFSVRWPDGSEHWLIARGQLVRDEAGRPLRFSGVNWDITERKRAEKALEEAQRAEQANRAKSEFMARMSHELRTPLNAVLGFAQLLDRDEAEPLRPRQRERLDRILGAGRHLLSLIDDVLQLSRIEADPRPVRGEPVRLDEVCHEAMQWLHQTARDREVVLDGAEPLAGAVWSERRWLGQIVSNLLSNAIKYNRAGGWVRLRSRPEERDGVAGWVLSVQDSGRGILADQLERIFQPFERLGAETEGIEGTGIGLAIVRQLAQRLGGAIDVRSTAGVGSEFLLWLPAAPTPLTPSRSGAAVLVAPEAQGPPPPLKLLCIEDNPVNMMLVREVLRLRPHIEFQGADFGLQGLALLTAWRPQVVLLDLQLPDLPGLEVLKRLRADPANRGMRVIALSANAMPQDVEDAVAAGFDDYWTKPIEIDRFLKGIDALSDSLQGASRSRTQPPPSPSR
jgi:PAS domain S-box-containing protein